MEGLHLDIEVVSRFLNAEICVHKTRYDVGIFCGMLRGADVRLFSTNRFSTIFRTVASVLPRAICRSSLKVAKSPPTKTCVHGNIVIIMNHH